MHVLKEEIMRRYLILPVILLFSYVPNNSAVAFHVVGCADFTMCDTDHDGQLTQWEFGACGLPPSDFQSYADLDANGHVDEEEYANYCIAHSKP